MTEHDGLIAAEQTYCAYCNAVYRIDDDIALIQAHIYECPEHPLPKALARAESAEARVAELEAENAYLRDAMRMAFADIEVGQINAATNMLRRTLAALTAEAVTEVEGS